MVQFLLQDHASCYLSSPGHFGGLLILFSSESGQILKVHTRPHPGPCPPLRGCSQASSLPQLHFFSFSFDSHLSLPNRFRFLPSLKTDGQVNKSSRTPKFSLLLPSSLAVIYHFGYVPSSLKMFNWRILTMECNSHCFFSCKLKAFSACSPHSICLVELQCPHQPSGDFRS